MNIHSDNATATVEPDRTHRPAAVDTSVTGLLTKLGADISDLIGTEMQLARSEIDRAAQDVKTGIASLLASAVVLFAGVLVLLAAASLALAQLTDLSLWSATLIVGLVVTVAGFIMLQSGKKKLSAGNLEPNRTQASLQKDRKMVERKLS